MSFSRANSCQMGAMRMPFTSCRGRFMPACSTKCRCGLSISVTSKPFLRPRRNVGTKWPASRSMPHCAMARSSAGWITRNIVWLPGNGATRKRCRCKSRCTKFIVRISRAGIFSMCATKLRLIRMKTAIGGFGTPSARAPWRSIKNSIASAASRKACLTARRCLPGPVKAICSSNIFCIYGLVPCAVMFLAKNYSGPTNSLHSIAMKRRRN